MVDGFKFVLDIFIGFINLGFTYPLFGSFSLGSFIITIIIICMLLRFIIKKRG